MPRKLIAGNWKMNGTRQFARDLSGALLDRLRAAGSGAPPCDWLLCPPAPLLTTVGEAVSGSPVALGGQDCHSAESGAHTGDVSAPMLADVGCSHVIVGHSERRQNHGEDDALVRAKAQAALAAGLTPIVCIGETEEERAAGRTLDVLERQLTGSLPPLNGSNALVVAYEPVWAIGTGRTATPLDVAEAHRHIRGVLGGRLGAASAGGVRLLYGGSVKPGNAAELLAVEDVDGALVGGASLSAEDFWAIGAACA